jgi:hypothetical protein
MLKLETENGPERTGLRACNEAIATAALDGGDK